MDSFRFNPDKTFFQSQSPNFKPVFSSDESSAFNVPSSGFKLGTPFQPGTRNLELGTARFALSCCVHVPFGKVPDIQNIPDTISLQPNDKFLDSNAFIVRISLIKPD